MGAGPVFDDWVAARGPALLRLAYVLTGNAAEAHEIVEEALSRALARWSRISRRQDRDDVVRRLVVHAHRSRGRRFRRKELPPPPRQSEAATGVGVRLRDVVWHSCGSLPPEQRAALVLRFYEDLRYDEIAELTGVREAVVRSAVSEGLAALQTELADR